MIIESQKFVEQWLFKAECNRAANFLNSFVDQKS